MKSILSRRATHRQRSMGFDLRRAQVSLPGLPSEETRPVLNDLLAGVRTDQRRLALAARGE